MRDRIFITETDYDKLCRLVAGRRGSRADADHLNELEGELERAEVLADKRTVPPDVITMGSEVRLMDVDLQEGDLEIVGRPAAATLRIVTEGKLGGVAVFFRAHLDEELQLTNSPLAPITSWGWDVRTFSQRTHVSPGDEVTLSLEIESTFGRQRMTIDLA